MPTVALINIDANFCDPHSTLAIRMVRDPSLGFLRECEELSNVLTLGNRKTRAFFNIYPQNLIAIPNNVAVCRNFSDRFPLLSSEMRLKNFENHHSGITTLVTQHMPDFCFNFAFY